MNIWKFIKEEGRKDGEEVTGPPEEATHDNVLSQNVKINYKIADGFAKQIQNNPSLQVFKLLNYRLNWKSWESLGRGLGAAQTLRHFAC